MVDFDYYINLNDRCSNKIQAKVINYDFNSNQIVKKI